MKISACIIAFNEERNIGRAVESVRFADEILVVDSGSSDATRDLAEAAGARVIVRDWPGFSAQKQFAVDSATYDWVLSVDADEAVSPTLRQSITRISASETPSYDAFEFSRLSFYGARPIRHGGWYPDRSVRLWDRRKGRWRDTLIHESVELLPGAKIGRLAGDLLHYTISGAAEHNQMIARRYAPLGAAEMEKHGRSASGATAFASGMAVFVKTYLLRRGFLDGRAGLCVAWFAAHNAFLKHILLAEKLASANESRGR